MSNIVDNTAVTIMEIVVVSTPSELESGLKNLRRSLTRNAEAGAKRVVGLGYFRVSDHGVCSDGLKLATATFCLWINLRSSCITPPRSYAALDTFLQLPEITFVGLGIHRSLDALQASYGLRFWDVIDLASLAADVTGDKRLRVYGLIDLAWSVCNIRVEPSLLESYLDSAVFARASPDSYADFMARGQLMEANSLVVDAHLAFLIGNRLLGGALPYELHRYGMYSEATNFLGMVAEFVESLCSLRRGMIGSL